MKVLLVSDFYPPRPGGLEAHVARLGSHLVGRGHAVTVATVGDRPAHVDAAGVAVHEFGLTLDRAPGAYQSDRAFHPPWADPSFRRSVEALARSGHFDVIHAHGWSVFTAAAVGDRLGIPVVATLHDYGLLCPSKTLACAGHPCRSLAGLCCVPCRDCDQSLPKRAVLSAALRIGRDRVSRTVAKFLAVSSNVAAEHQARGLGNESSLTVVPNFVDLTDHAPRLAPASGPIVCVAPDAPYKGGQITEAAYRSLPDSLRPGLVRVGTSAVSSAAGVDRRGRLSGEALWQVHRDALFASVTPVWPDPCPTVALEAMALGRAVVGTHVGGLSDIVVDGETGILVPPGDTAAVAAAFTRLLRDPDLAGRMGAAGRERVRTQFSAEAVVSQIEGIYREVTQ